MRRLLAIFKGADCTLARAPVQPCRVALARFWRLRLLAYAAGGGSFSQCILLILLQAALLLSWRALMINSSPLLPLPSLP